ncbi:type II toxin-antitoxin system PemK/MazF family toxin [Microbacterium sp. STN6]|uniref:type II toxin-antitoxin system PemK/MazF family toxin n=1 Tax=Microbacterium sp. STN6 TaxID=2995588 RepID=UPI002260BADB|nr:type II toxin-antitoxin system PemK/MazF family toxin [Microbacterium sp. STN6]MCX7521982.1 type II toxin-antitoxin system PemK/MazF family toxin [Microbacterium sp. STN6]
MSGATPLANAILRRGQIVLVELDPAVGSEQGKVRPAVIVGNNAANGQASRSGRGVITIAPITSNTKTVHAFQVLVGGQETGLAVESKVQAEQVRSISVSRIVRPLGWVSAEQMRDVDDALRLHLSL